MLSASFMASVFTQPEWAQAFRLDPTGEKRLLIPVRIEKCELKGLFGPLVYIDFLEEKPPEITELRDHLIKLLIEGVRLDRKKPEHEPPMPRFVTSGGTKPAQSFNSDRTMQQSVPKSEVLRIERDETIFGDKRIEIRNSLEKEWLRQGNAVAVLQGFPGTGKTRMATSLVQPGWITIDPIELGAELENQEVDLLIDLATALDAHGIDDLVREMEKGEAANPLTALRNVIRRERILVIVDEFQRFFSNDEASPPEAWQKFIEILNNSSSSAGRLLLVSNRIIVPARWNEGCVIKDIARLSEIEAAEFFRARLDERGLLDRVPNKRIAEIGVRLGGNPRALNTLVGSLVYDSLDDLISTMPEPSEIGDVRLEQQLLQKFERELIFRAIANLGIEEVSFMRWLAINRRPVSRSFYEQLQDSFSDPKSLRRVLIERFLIEAGGVGDLMHPLAREISVTRLRDDLHEWKRAHSCAGNYHLGLFRKLPKATAGESVASFVELRHHLFEAGRLAELSNVCEKMATFVLSRIPGPTQSKTPRSTEILEEHIVLIQALPEERRTKGLEYHLALCLRERNGPGDFQFALTHARRAVGRKAYYAVWLLLADLEYLLNGIEPMLCVAQRALENLGVGSNSFAVYHHCADLLDKDGLTTEAVSFLERGIGTPGVEGKASLLALCARLLEKLGEGKRAVELLSKACGGGALKEAGIVYAHGASLLIEQGQAIHAIELLDQGIAKKAMTKLFSLYLMKADALVAIGQDDMAVQALLIGIADKRVIDPVRLFRKCAELYAEQGQINQAIKLLREGVCAKTIRDPAPLYLSTAAILERIGKFEVGAKLLNEALGMPLLCNDPTMYLACARMYFRSQELEKASEVLERGLRQPKLRERNQLVVKLAEMMTRRGLSRNAIELLQDVIVNGSDPRHLGEIYRYCAELLANEGDLNRAEVVLESGIRAAAMTDKGMLVQARAKILVKQHKQKEAVILLRDAIGWPGIAGVVMLYQTGARILAKSGRIDEAVNMLRSAFEDKKIGNLGSLYALSGEILASEGRMPEAIEILSEGISEFPKDQSIKALHTKLIQKRRE